MLNTFVGTFHNLIMVMSSYQPAVSCYGSVGQATTVAQSLIDMVPTTTDEQTFGYSGAPNVQVALPQTFLQPASKGYGPSDTKNGFYATLYCTDRRKSFAAHWFDVWAAVISINTLCVREGHAGKAKLQGALQIKVDRSYKPPPNSILEESAGNAPASLVNSE